MRAFTLLSTQVAGTAEKQSNINVLAGVWRLSDALFDALLGR